MTSVWRVVTARIDRLSPRLAGIGLMCLTLVCFTGIDTSAKWLGRELPPLEVSFFRYLVAFLIAAAMFDPWRCPGAWRTKRPLWGTPRKSPAMNWGRSPGAP